MHVRRKENFIEYYDRNDEYAIDYCFNIATTIDTEWGFFTYSVGTKTIKPFTSTYEEQPFIKKVKNIPSNFSCVYIAKGKGFFFNNSIGKTEISEGTMFFGFPGIFSAYSPDPGTGWTEYWIEFEGPYAQMLKNNHVISPEHPIIWPGMDDILINLFSDIMNLLKSNLLYKQYINTLGIQIIARGLSLNLHNSTDQQKPDYLVYKSMSFINEHYGTSIDYEMLAKKMGISYDSFRRIFKKVAGTSPHNYLLNVRIEKAKEILKQSHYTVKEIAGKVGFDDPLYFSRLFKKFEGVSPTEWEVRQ